MRHFSVSFIRSLTCEGIDIKCFEEPILATTFYDKKAENVIYIILQRNGKNEKDEKDQSNTT